MKRVKVFITIIFLAIGVAAQEQRFNIPNDSLPRIDIYPNPAFEVFYVQTKNIFPNDYTLKIFDSNEKLVLETKAISLSKGTYSIQIVSGGNIYYRKIIVQ
ncbi:MAG: T9SS type A sorting domain-containing protein [Bacteroidetes bacterium]|nr:T9SS type A sorting domain-containing protein [Bacteroidota bacterium]